MKYTLEEFKWEALLRAKTKLNEEFVKKLESFNFRGTPNRIYTRINGIDFTVYGADGVVADAEVDILFEKRNDGRLRISIVPENPRGISMSLQTVTEHILRFMGVCEDGKKEIFNEIFSGAN